MSFKFALPFGIAVTLAVVVVAPSAPVLPEKPKTTWTMYGGTPGRNMVNLTDKNIADDCDPETGRNILWKADLGSRAYTQPIIANGKIYVGTNNEQPRNPRDSALNADGDKEPFDRGVMMCFEQSTGKFLWQSVHRKLESGQVNDWPREGIASSPAVEGNRVYYVSNRAEVVCLDSNGFADGNQGFQREHYQSDSDADVLWSFDMIKELKVFPHNLACCSPLIVGDLVFVVTGNGVDENHINIPEPNAPSFIAINKHSGKLVWKDNSPGKDILHGQWGIPSYAAEPVPQVIFPGGDGWLRAFDPPTGKLLWKFNCNKSTAKYELGGTGDKCDFVNVAPVVHNGRVYIGTGQDPEHFTGTAFFWCIDLVKAVKFGATKKSHDVSPVNDNFDPTAEVNTTSALAWVYGGDDKRTTSRRDFLFGRTMSTACIVGDVLYAVELHGFLHCFDARTGKRFWSYDTKRSIWNAPFYADGKVCLATEMGDLLIFKHFDTPVEETDVDFVRAMAPNKAEGNKQAKLAVKQFEAKMLIRKIEFDAPIRTALTVVDGVLYIVTEKTLYAIAEKR